jgi:hypothetical protein
MKTLFKYLTESNSKEKQEFVELWNKNSTPPIKKISLLRCGVLI